MRRRGLVLRAQGAAISFDGVAELSDCIGHARVGAEGYELRGRPLGDRIRLGRTSRCSCALACQGRARSQCPSRACSAASRRGRK